MCEMTNGHEAVVEAIKCLQVGEWDKKQNIAMMKYLLEVGTLLGAKHSQIGEDITMVYVQHMIRCGWDRDAAMKCRDSAAVCSWRRSGPRLHNKLPEAKILHVRSREEMITELLKGAKCV